MAQIGALETVSGNMTSVCQVLSSMSHSAVRTYFHSVLPGAPGAPAAPAAPGGLGDQIRGMWG